MPCFILFFLLRRYAVGRLDLCSSNPIQDLDLEKGEFRIKPKAKRSNRLGFLDPELTAALQEYLDWREIRAKDNAALWISYEGTRISRNYVYNTVTKLASRMGLYDRRGPLNKKFTPHCFRHFFTTHLRRAKMPREFIQELRGDRRKDAVDIYDHIEIEELRRTYLACIPSLGTGPGRRGTLEEWCKWTGSIFLLFFNYLWWIHQWLHHGYISGYMYPCFSTDNKQNRKNMHFLWRVY